ncbi:hypothetical protein [Desulfobacula sp.]|nr:hypothetical protein [Desulfobacula sp.]
MKQATDTVKQWLWFVALWCCGLLSVALLAKLIRWIIRLGNS